MASSAVSTAASHGQRIFRHLQQFWINYLVGLLQDVDQIFGLFDVGDGEKRVSSACVCRTSGSSNTMDVILGARGIIKIDDEFDVINVQAPSGDVRGNKNRRLAKTELVENVFSLLLRLVTVDADARPLISHHATIQFIHSTFCFSENQGFVFLFPHDFFHEADEFLFFLRLGADVDDLEDVVVGGELKGPDGDVDVVVEEVFRQSAHLLGPGSAEHQHLAIRTNLLDDFADLRLETHVQHSVSFV